MNLDALAVYNKNEEVSDKTKFCVIVDRALAVYRAKGTRAQKKRFLTSYPLDRISSVKKPCNGPCMNV